MYALPEADIDQRRAVMAGGRVGCVSALRRVGVWGGLDTAIHIHVPSHDWLADPMSALRQAVLCLDDEHAIAAIDSALRKQIIRSRDLGPLFASLPRRLQPLLTELDSAADSGPESIVRVRMRRAGFVVEPQVSIPGSSDLDLLINGVVGLDIDSRAWHTGEEQVSWDYGKTLQSFAFGRPTLRILPHHIFEMWPSTLAAIGRAVSDMEELHRLRRKNRHRSTGRN